MSKLTIKDGKLYRKGTKKVGLAEYLEWAVGQPYLPSYGSGQGCVSVTGKEVALDDWDTETTIDVTIRRYSYKDITSMEFDIDAEVLVDLRRDTIPVLSVTIYDNGYTPTYVGERVVSGVNGMSPGVERKILYYIDTTNGETLKVWDDENGLAWEVE